MKNLTSLSHRGVLPSLDVRGKESGKWQEGRVTRLDTKGSRENGWNGGYARWYGSWTVTTYSQGRVGVMRNPLNVMAQLAKVVEGNGTSKKLDAPDGVLGT
ncbi:hypothetical protein CRG98_024177 [Punica granatum]|uniref:Uncharacterized protein n=1 Tax=Punica granatum TaxID=22663 RepID=A0A2I0JGM2_PUNGR|nr:hypothetical protein CRG98_024177 [Punica granatum]